MTTTHPLPGLPHGFTSRGVDPATDVTPVTEMCNAASQAEDGIDEVDEQVQRESYRSPGFDPKRDALVVHDGGGGVVATAEYWDNEEAHVSPYLYLRIHPDVVNEEMGAGIGAAVVAWAERRGALTLELAAPDLAVT